MKPVIYEDPHGFKQLVLIRDSDDPLISAQYGVPVGPPDLREIDMDEMLVQMNHILVSEEIFTWADAQKNPIGVTAVVNLFKRKIIDLYRQREIDQKQAKEK